MRIDKSEIVINGKFLLAALEGMPRVAREITAVFDEILGDSSYTGPRIRILAPRGAARTIILRNIVVEEVGSRQGLLWEQIDLPMRLRGRYCVNFTSTAPIAHRHGCVVIHDAQFRSVPASHSWKSSLLYGRITPFVGRRYKTIVTDSLYAHSELIKYDICRRDDIHVIRLGVDHMNNRSEDLSILAMMGIEPGAYILSNSYVHFHKNVPILFDALKDRPELSSKLVLFGTSVKASFEERGISVPAGVRFTGRINDEQLVALMRNAAMFLFPSTTEGFGLPPLEAMALGCPTICSDAGAMNEVCADGAMFVPASDATAWRTAIERLWNDPALRHELANSGRKKAGEYLWRETATQYLDLIVSESER